MGVGFLRFVDKYFFGAATVVIGPFVKLFSNNQPPKVEKVLIIKLWAIGDSILTLPMIHAIKKKYPNVEIDILCHKSNKIVYENNKEINRLIMFSENINEMKLSEIINLFKKYNVCIDTEPFLNLSSMIAFYSAKKRVGFKNRLRWMFYNKTVDNSPRNHALEKYLEMAKYLGALGEKKLIKLDYGESAKKKAEKILKEAGIKKDEALIGLFAGVGNSVKARQWPKENFKQLAEKIVDEKKVKVILFGTKEDKELNEFIKNKNKNIIDLTGKANLEETFALIERINTFVSNDTGPMHIAAAQGVKTIAIFGPSSPVLWAPYGKSNKVIYHGTKVCEYAPCNMPHKGKVKECIQTKDKKDICIRSVTVDEVFKSI